jgi:hypothetical protein
MAQILNCVGDFKNPWTNTIEEAEHIAAWKWSPGTDTWQAVFGKDVIVISSLSQFLGLIEKQKPQSVQRINLLSHGTRGLIAFNGQIISKTGEVMLNSATGLNLKIGDIDPISKGGGKYEEPLGAIARRLSDRFINGAEIVFYLCNSGVDLELLRRIADAFQVVASTTCPQPQART